MSPEIKTERLLLRPFRREDGPCIHALLGEWDVAKMLAVVPHPYPAGAAEQWIATHAPRREAGTAYVFAITLNNEVCGAIGIDKRGQDFVLGYWLGIPYWGQGLMSEAVAGVIDFAFTTLALPRLTSGHFAENDRSARILRKAGFTIVGRGPKRCVARDEDVDHVDVALKRDTWRDSGSEKSGIK